jgi:hypothetical protein
MKKIAELEKHLAQVTDRKRTLEAQAETIRAEIERKRAELGAAVYAGNDARKLGEAIRRDELALEGTQAAIPLCEADVTKAADELQAARTLAAQAELDALAGKAEAQMGRAVEAVFQALAELDEFYALVKEGQPLISRFNLTNPAAFKLFSIARLLRDGLAGAAYTARRAQPALFAGRPDVVPGIESIPLQNTWQPPRDGPEHAGVSPLSYPRPGELEFRR